MQEFLITLYEIENFTTYLTITIAVLVVLFFLVLFLGKKDQKLEETKRLQKLEVDGFKEVSSQTNVEIVNPKEALDEMKPFDHASVVEQTLNTVNSDAINNISSSNETISALDAISQDETSEPISLNEIGTVSTLGTFETENYNDSESAPIMTESVLPDMKFDEIVKNFEQSPLNENQVEQLVITPEVISPIVEVPAEIIPMVVEEPIEIVPPLTFNEPELVVTEEVKKPIGQPIFSSVHVPKKEEDDVIDLTHVNELKEINNLEQTQSFNSILGETYEIK